MTNYAFTTFSQMPTIFIFHDDTHAFARGVKIERVEQSVFPHLTLEGDLQQTAVGPMEHYTIPGREYCFYDLSVCCDN